jgi:hypothetical protein
MRLGIPGQVHARGTCRRLALTAPANPGDRVAFDEKRGVLDGRAAVADEESGAFKPCRARGHLGVRVNPPDQGGDQAA